MTYFPIMSACNSGPLVELVDATENPLFVMAVAWETMLGDPRKIIETGEYGNYIEDILAAKHKTVFEYVHLSMKISGVQRQYLSLMASCRAGFSVVVKAVPDNNYNSLGVTHVGEIGCTFRALFDWMNAGYMGGSADHENVKALIIDVVSKYNEDLGGVLMEVGNG
ncbi:MAG: FAD-dependent thymidylate synthase [Candidatus Peribacteraceae bacterium]|nr:FAD-dependent thymidylate synthase [Candidatus Peribacteraceae bacterium]